MKQRMGEKLKKPRKRDISAFTAVLVMIIAAAVSPIVHNWKDRQKEHVRELLSRYPSLEEMQAAYHPLISKEVSIIFVCYLVAKFGYRAVWGSAVDKRGWGREAYWSAILHQIATLAVWITILVRRHVVQDCPVTLDNWFEATWAQVDGAGLRLERVTCAMQMAEMITDSIMYTRYPGYNMAYWAHHLTTFFAAAGFFIVERCPVGFAVCYGSIMESGSIALNYSNLYPSPGAYIARAIFYISSRVVATGFMVKMTYMAIFRPEVIAWVPLALLWVLLFVNYKWAYAIGMSTYRRSYVWSTGRVER